MDKRHEWVTADNQTPTLMSYRGKPNSAAAMPIEMQGEFTDLGVTGEQNVGKPVPMPTTIHIVNPDQHVFEIFFTPPGGAEMLADRMVFDRVK